MDPYIVSLLIGVAGLGVMAVSGLAHHGHEGSGSHGHGHNAGQAHHDAGHGGAHTHGHVQDHGASSGHSHATGHHASPAQTHGGDSAGRAALTLMSPRFLFSALLGFGFAGLLFRPVLGGVLLLVTAIAGGLAFERVLVRPLWDYLMRFASKPALTLESCIMEDATAVTSFDGNGQGIVAVELDGQVIQLLATLQPADRTLAGRVRAGAHVRIEDVDTARNRCTVSLL